MENNKINNEVNSASSVQNETNNVFLSGNNKESLTFINSDSSDKLANYVELIKCVYAGYLNGEYEISCEQIDDILTTSLTPRAKKMIAEIFGLHDGESKSINKVAEKYGITYQSLNYIYFRAVAEMSLPDSEISIYIDNARALGSLEDETLRSLSHKKMESVNLKSTLVEGIMHVEKCISSKQNKIIAPATSCRI